MDPAEHERAGAEVAPPLGAWALLPADVLRDVLASLPALALARLRRTCAALRAAADPIILSRLAALRPWDVQPQGRAARLYRLEAARGHVVAMGGFSTLRHVVPEGTPDDDQNDADGCLQCLEILTPAGSPAADLHADLLRGRPDYQRVRFSHRPMPVQRADLAAVCIDAGVIYAIGGRCGGTDESTVQRVDLAGGQSRSAIWEDVEPMVLPLSGVAAAPLSTHRFLVAGGANRSSFRATSLAQVYDSQANSWTIADEMNQFRYFSSAVAIREEVVAAIGGVSETGSSMGSRQSFTSNLKLVEVYDGSNDRWASGPQLLQARYGCAAALAPSGRAVVIGGEDSENPQGSTLDSVEAVDLRAPTGVALASLPVRLWGATAVAVPSTGEIMCLGGNVKLGLLSTKDESSSSVFLYCERTGSWREAPGMAVPRWCGAAVPCAF